MATIKQRECKYECGTLLSGFDEEEHKYKEAETGYLHTEERCKAMKAKKGTTTTTTIQTETSKQNEEKIKNGGANLKKLMPDYVDHTAKGASRVGIFTSSDAEVVEEAYNEFLKDNKGKIKTQGAQYQMCSHGDDLKHSIALYYEEV